MTRSVPKSRIRPLNEAPARPERTFVLYWMVGQRRVRYNFALDHAVELALEFGKPLVIFEPLRVGYRWSSPRHHRFIIEGMRDNRDRLDSKDAFYFPYVEEEAGAGSGLFEHLASSACAVVTDDYPGFFIPRMQAAASERIDVSLEAVDSIGLFPMHSTERVFTTAHSFRAHLQKNLQGPLSEAPKKDAFLNRSLPTLDSLQLEKGWSPADLDALLDGAIEKLPLEHDVPAVKGVEGGSKTGEKIASEFVKKKLSEYPEDRNQPEQDGTSGLSPYLHYGHVSTHAIFEQIASAEDWTVDLLPEKGGGSREGWWKMSKAAEAFLDELVTWREIGFNMASHVGESYEDFESLPEWALKTLDDHRGDEREHVYSLAEFEAAETHDELWNAAQKQLVTEGRIHNYLRMLWGKKILEWSETPEAAHGTLVELNNKYALDGRDPNSYSGIMWVLGRYDRAWGPERKIFGKVRYMSSDNTARKVRVKDYVARFARIQLGN